MWCKGIHGKTTQEKLLLPSEKSLLAPADLFYKVGELLALYVISSCVWLYFNKLSLIAVVLTGLFRAFLLDSH
jgi:hypothetical protein